MVLQKCGLVLVSANPGKQLERAVAEFNLSSGQYRIRLETMTELQLDSALVAGNVPDLLDIWFLFGSLQICIQGRAEGPGTLPGRWKE